MSGLRIYGIARTRAFRALWMANELGLDFEHLPIEIGADGARSPEFLAINPNGRLPFIADNDFVLSSCLRSRSISPRSTPMANSIPARWGRGKRLAVELGGRH